MCLFLKCFRCRIIDLFIVTHALNHQRTLCTKLLINCQPDAHLAAEEEERRLEELHREAEKERRKQLEKAQVRGSHALKKIQLAKVGKVVMPVFNVRTTTVK